MLLRARRTAPSQGRSARARRQPVRRFVDSPNTQALVDDVNCRTFPFAFQLGGVPLGAAGAGLILEGTSMNGSSIAVTTSAASTLRQSPIPALRLLQVEENETQVIISGRVSSYYMKQLAQESLMPCLEHRLLLNQVVVESKR